MNKLYQKKQGIRFRRWSRKAYAMFCSLGKYVTIGNLKKGIADVSLGKQANVCASYSVCQSVDEKEEDDEEKTEERWDSFDIILQTFFSYNLNHKLSGWDFSILKYIKQFKPEWCVMHLSGFFVSKLK